MTNSPKPPVKPGTVENAAAEHKARRGPSRLWHATCYSVAGLKAGLSEAAFRMEVTLSVVMIPLSMWLGQSWVERALLAGTVVLVLVAELLNSGIEAAMDRIGTQWHPLVKRGKDMGSAAVFLCLLLCGATWSGALWQRFGP